MVSRVMKDNAIHTNFKQMQLISIMTDTQTDSKLNQSNNVIYKYFTKVRVGFTLLSKFQRRQPIVVVGHIRLYNSINPIIRRNIIQYNFISNRKRLHFTLLAIVFFSFELVGGVCVLLFDLPNVSVSHFAEQTRFKISLADFLQHIW